MFLVLCSNKSSEANTSVEGIDFDFELSYKFIYFYQELFFMKLLCLD